MTGTLLLILFSLIGLGTLGFFGIKIMNILFESEDDE